MSLFIDDPTPTSGAALSAMADVVGPDGTHVYWSTHCRHGRHEDCAATELAPGVPRQPAQCKTCAAPCVCPCNHGQDGTDSRLAGAGLLLVPQGMDFPSSPDDPTPTTGGPVEYEPPDGCVCHIREYTDVGDQRYAPPEGCRVHTPWAFPGYSLTQETDLPSALLGVVPDVATASEVSPCGEGCECRGGP